VNMSAEDSLPDSARLAQQFKRLWLLDASDVPPGPWSRREDEDGLWYDRFLLYVSLGPSRTVQQARSKAKTAGTQAPKNDVTDWVRQAQLYDWEPRAGAYDDFVNQLTLRASMEARVMLQYFAPDAAVKLVQLLNTEDALAAAKSILDRAAVPTETKINLSTLSDDQLKQRIAERLARLGLNAGGTGTPEGDQPTTDNAVGQE
jgi:hypothetical protein